MSLYTISYHSVIGFLCLKWNKTEFRTDNNRITMFLIFIWYYYKFLLYKTFWLMFLVRLLIRFVICKWLKELNLQHFTYTNILKIRCHFIISVLFNDCMIVVLFRYCVIHFVNVILFVHSCKIVWYFAFQKHLN